MIKSWSPFLAFLLPTVVILHTLYKGYKDRKKTKN
jgi:hypothetical protein